MSRDGQTRFSEAGHGVWIGAQSACLRASEFARVIHITTPGEISKCRGVQQEHLHLWWDNKKDWGEKNIRRVFEYAKNDDRLLVHCGAGMHRSPTLAIVALIARGLTIGEAVGNVVGATCGYGEEPIFPWLHFSSLEEIRRVLG